jgi:hypothetical protein
MQNVSSEPTRKEEGEVWAAFSRSLLKSVGENGHVVLKLYSGNCGMLLGHRLIKLFTPLLSSSRSTTRLPGADWANIRKHSDHKGQVRTELNHACKMCGLSTTLHARESHRFT